ncbi:MAG: type II toxin-antitoxin system VapC family toxin [Mycobacteriales bacterium]
MIADTSAWVEFLRATGSASHRRLVTAVRDGEQVVVLDIVLLELLSGAASEARASELRRFLAAFTAVPAASPADHELGAELYRAARRAGETIRSLLDCLVAAAALRLDLPVLARDRDFEVLARVSPLRLA